METPYEQIRSMLGRYCEAIDRADFDAVGALFAKGALASDDGTVLAAGAQQVAAFYRRIVRLHDGSPRTKHLTVNPIIDLDGDGCGATVRSSYLVLQALPGQALVPIVAGRYRDRFAPDAAGTWRFVERRFAIDLGGDLTAHLGDPVG